VLQARYTEGLGIDEPLEIRQQSMPFYYHADGLGSIVAVTNASRQVAASYTYDAFGTTTMHTQIVVSPYGFTGREFASGDGNAPGPGLYYYRARLYDPLIGRFLSEDPSQFARGVSLYTYVFNDPANEVDPSGLAECLYRISSHTLQCVSRTNIKSPPIVVGPESVSSGSGPCKDEPACIPLRGIGPIVPGEYRMNRDSRPGHEGIYRLEPIPKIPWWQYYSGLKRGGFELHPGTRTVGCINVLKTDPRALAQYDRLRKLLEAEDGRNYLLVAP
jgi:RHS repeat-associated protein